MNFSATTTNIKGKALNILSMQMLKVGLWNTVFIVYLTALVRAFRISPSRRLEFFFFFFLSSEKGMHAKQATQPKMELQPQLEPEFGY